MLIARLVKSFGNIINAESLEQILLDCLLLPDARDQREYLVNKVAMLFASKRKYLGIYKNKYYVKSKKFQKLKTKMNKLISRYINNDDKGIFKLFYNKPKKFE